jgi:signal transduction histidine kinase
MIAVERIRTRIATDLHDDVGASLSQIAILSEVVRRQVEPTSAATETLSAIAATSRELVDSMSDIVWAINPNRDLASDLLQKMRRFASDSFTACNIAFAFDVRDVAPQVKLGPDVRRQIFLVFKEGVNNIVRHSQCTRASIVFSVENGSVRLVLEDDGKGFDGGRPADGQGLASMRRRAGELRARLELQSQPGRGTRVSLEMPLDRGWLPRKSARQNGL